MSSIIRSISLDPDAAARARKIPNFSKFVRECLRRHEEITLGRSLCPTLDERGLCNPFHVQRPRCMSCWPAGPPDRADWGEYNKGESEVVHIAQTTVEERYFHENTQKWIEARRVGDRRIEVIPPGPHYHDQEWITERALAVNPPLFSFEKMSIEGNAKPIKKTQNTIFRRFLNRIGA